MSHLTESQLAEQDLYNRYVEAVNRQSHDRLSFLPRAPCAWLCQRLGFMKRFHLTCLTCPLRIFHFQKRGYERYTRKQNVVMVLESASGKGFVIPKRFQTYGLIIPVNPTTGYAHPLKIAVLKVLLTIAERIAEF